MRGVDHSQRSALVERCIDEIMAVMHVALDGEIGVPGRDGSAVDGEAGDSLLHRAADGGAHRLRHVRCSPERRGHATLDASAAAAASWSLNGSVRWPMIWPVSWPLTAISSASPGSRPDIAVRIASARSAISVAPVAAARIAARIAEGSSLRG